MISVGGSVVRVLIRLMLAAWLLGANVEAMTISRDALWLDTPPASASRGGLASGDHAFLWLENSQVAIATSQDIDIIPFLNNPDGRYASRKKKVQSSWRGTIAPGAYSSFMLHAANDGRRAAQVAGSITFDTEIVGVIYTDKSLLDSDLLFGWADTSYAGRRSKRGFELAAGENDFLISGDRRSLRYQMLVRKDINEMRIITRAGSIQSPATVPVPASVWLFGSALGMIVWIRRQD